jgi:hypothetical protein
MTYDLVFKSSFSELIDGVNTRIRHGWKPQGGIAITVDSNGDKVYYQAMIRE